MARRLVVEVKCSRCDRIEQKSVDEGAVSGDEPRPNALTVNLLGEDAETGLHFSFEDLCAPCRKTVRALLEQVGKRIEGVSPDRSAAPAKRKGKKEEPAHHGQQTPPNTHSAASSSSSPTRLPTAATTSAKTASERVSS